MNGNAIVVGATGTVGRGIARTLATAGWSLLAVARDAAKLAALAAATPGIEVLAGSVADEGGAERLATAIRARRFVPDAIVVSINLPRSAERLLDMPADRLSAVLHGNVVTHHIAARALMPLLGADGRYLGIGGGMADLIFDDMGGISLGQAALRNMYRFYARETADTGPAVAELMLYAMIVDRAGEVAADPHGLRADEVGAHVRAILEQPDRFPGPILTLTSRRQVGFPQKTR